MLRMDEDSSPTSRMMFICGRVTIMVSSLKISVFGSGHCPHLSKVSETFRASSVEDLSQPILG